MEYIAHKDGDREQTVKEHLTGTAKLASEFAGKFGKADWGYCCGMLHDIGKYSKEFQKKIKEDTKATIRCIPFDSFVPGDKEPGKCMVTGKPSACRVIFARSY